jgi:SAM-dependent methyltransferase
MDALWLEVVNHLKSVSEDGSGVATHERFRVALPSVVSYEEIGSQAPEFLQTLVIHKGLYEQIDPSFLHGFLSRAKPTFANQVFIVLSTAGQALKSRHPHLGALRQIAQWAAARGDPSARHAVEEPTLSAEVALQRMADFIIRHLAKPLDPDRPDSPVVIAETAERFNDTAWFWVDDSGKTAELFALPQLRDRYSDIADATLDHVLRLSLDRIIQRRWAAPQLRLLRDNPEDFHAYNSFFNLTGNLKAGIVRPSIRFNDNRTQFLGEYSGNVLRFRFRGRRQAVDIEDSIVDWQIAERDDHLLFSHTSSITARPRLGRPRHVCNVTYRYRLWKARPAIELEAEISTLPGITLNDVQLSTGLDQLSAAYAFDTFISGWDGHFTRGSPPTRHVGTLQTGPADYVGVSDKGHAPGFSHAFHVRLRNGDQLGDIVAEGPQPGRFHWLYLRYALGRIRPERTHRVTEDRLLTGGGYYNKPEIYCQVLDGMASADNVDPSMSYDIGAELNAVALTLMMAKQRRYASPPDPDRLTVLKEWYDRHLHAYLDEHHVGDPDGPVPVFVRGLSFVILSLDCMTRAFGTNEYREALGSCVARLLEYERPVEGGAGETIFTPPPPPQLDSHCAALLALARAAAHGDPGNRISGALARSLRGTLILEASAEQDGRPAVIYESVWIRLRAGGPPQDGGFWVFKAALGLRAFNAIRQVHAAGFLQLDPKILEHVDTLAAVARRSLLQAVRREGDTIEVLTSAYSGETNSETQPWAALGLVPAIEWELYGRPAETAIQIAPDVAPATSPGEPVCVIAERSGTPPPPQAPAQGTHVQVIRTLQELDRKIEECNRAEAQSDDAMRAVFGTFRMDPPTDLPRDPFSSEYRAAQMQLYEMISGKKYSTDFERSYFDVERAVRRPFPFYTGSCTTAGNYIAAIGFLLRTMAMPPASRVIEFGPGWGLTSVWLAQLGHRVTVVELDQKFCDLIARRAAHENVEVEIINDDFSWIARTDRKFDSAIFFECFHHCADHIALLHALRRALDDSGALFFSAEPILADFPMPWGPRLDGNSLWAIRKNGWLELGFREDYFLAVLRKTGWLGSKLACPGLPMSVVWRAQKLQAGRIHLPATDARVQTRIGVRRDGVIDLASREGGSGIFGPYLDLPRGPYIARMFFSETHPLKGTAVMDVSTDDGSCVLAKRTIEAGALPETSMVATLPFESARDLHRLEIRLFCEADFCASVAAVEITPVD